MYISPYIVGGLAVVIVEVVLLIGYAIFKDKKED